MARHETDKQKTGAAGGPANGSPADAAPAPAPAAGPAAAGQAPAPSPPAPAEAELAALRDRLLRLQADFDNFRKRTQRERADTAARANEDLMLALLPVLDHFEIGLKAAAEHGVDPASLDGFRIVRDQLHAALARFGLEPIEAAGKPFDPHQHESVSTMYSDRVPRDEVAEELRRGYRLGSRLLRATQVVVSAGPAEATAAEG